MATRREAREWAIQMLFQLDMNPSDDIDAAFGKFWSDKQVDTGVREFMEQLVRGVRNNLEEIDTTIKKYAANWQMDRMAIVDRNVMRMAVYEMFFCKDIPPVVSINEAVDIAKYFASNESGRFVNGILDRIRKDIDRPARSKDS
ncbi:MAG: transcription antitermination factor NusB [Kiritimatiellae bacterium]|nr:transcription antitermination factor NusB [Kiritimatiellia bacterium]MDD5521269.1 transcription antitermination factor NusB [Kiritimatiellia bacterium]